jgi:Xaa-Pro aminopeptidase
MGIRIEDDILVTKQGSVNLTEALPKERKQIESIMSN